MTVHKPVLLKEAIELLNLKDGDVVVDATLGGGGHSRAILKNIGKTGVFIGFDLDVNSIKNFAEFPISNFQFLRPRRISLGLTNKFQVPIFKFKNIYLVNDNFSNLQDILEILGIKKVNAILADLGWSSDQLEGRGMSFAKDEPLDMRLDRKQDLTAKKIVNEYGQAELEKIFKDLGEERFGKNIARKIVEYRKSKKIETTGELSQLIIEAVPKRFQGARIHPATKIFQAIRIEVNQELENLEKFLPKAISALAPEGRLAVISFHSLEDRIVKNIFRENARGCICPPTFPKCVCGKVSKIKIVTRKPITADFSEISGNRKSRSAKMRICEKK